MGVRMHAAFEKMTSFYLNNEFLRSGCRFVEDFTRLVINIDVAARSILRQGVSCFCPEMFIEGDDHSASFFFVQLLDGLIACSWEKGLKVEACKAELQSSVWDQRQLDCHANR